MEIREWLSIILIVGIVLILLDGFRRKWLERKGRIVMKLDKNIPPADDGDGGDLLISSELPNGGARTKSRQGDKAPFPEDVPVLMDSVDLEEEEDIEELADSGEDDDKAPLYAEYAEENAFDVGADPAPEEDEPGLAADEPAIDDSPDEDPWRDDTPGEHDEDEGEDAVIAARAPADNARKGLTARLKDKLVQKGDGERIEPTFGDEELTFGLDEQGELDLAHNDLFEHDSEKEADDEADGGDETAAEVIIINVMAGKDSQFEGRDLLPVLLKQGLRLGDMSIFHRHADSDGKGPVMFSMANMLRPGTFSLAEMEEFTTPGVSFFMQMPNRLGNMASFDQMLKAALAVKESLSGVLRDENRSVFTPQTVEHCRQRIRDFELEQLAKK